MRDEALKEQMEKETLGAFREPALKSLEGNKEMPITAIAIGAVFVLGIILGAIIG